MKPKDKLIINLNVDWRILVILIAIAGVLVSTYSAAGAQNGNPPTINHVQAEHAANPPEPTPVTLPEGSDSQAGDLRLTINGEWVPRDTVGATSPSASDGMQALARSGSSGYFYLTDTNYDPDQALTACASGYHMASLWELLDVSNLTYNRDHPAAYVKPDSGHGPPSGWNGWVRTGYDSSAANTAGIGNCLTWTSSSAGDEGTAIQLSITWETGSADIFTWNAGTYTCNLTGPVWCVEDGAP